MNHRYCLLLLITVLGGCAGSPAPPPNAFSMTTTKPDSRLRGQIKSVNQQGQYAIVDFGLGTIPPLGSEMNIYRGNEVMGVLRLTGPARRNIVASDIISGEAAGGDEAIWENTREKKEDAADKPQE
jgi:hypothetical protein